MFEPKTLLGIISVCIAFVSYGIYFREIFLGKTKPHAFSWLVWGTLDAIGFAAQVFGNAGPGAWMLGISSFLCFCVFVIALLKGEKGYTRLDWISLACALVALLAWVITWTPMFSVVLITFVSICATIPTFRKSFLKPHEESIALFSLNFFKSTFSVLALQTYSMITVFYPAAITLINASMVAMLYLRRKFV